MFHKEVSRSEESGIYTARENMISLTKTIIFIEIQMPIAI